MEAGLESVFTDINELIQLQEIEVNETKIKLDIILGGDMKFILILLGLNVAFANYSCIWYHIHKKERTSVFSFSHSGRPYTVDELTNNLFQLLPLREQPLSAEDVSQDPYSLVYRRIEHLFISDGELQWYNGTVLVFNPETSEYRVVYEGEDKEYNFNLVDDLLNRELIVC